MESRTRERYNTAERILVAEYDSARDDLSQWQRHPERYPDHDLVVERCISAMRRLRMFLTDKDIPADVADRLDRMAEGQDAVAELRRQIAQAVELTSMDIHLGEGRETPDVLSLTGTY